MRLSDRRHLQRSARPAGVARHVVAAWARRQVGGEANSHLLDPAVVAGHDHAVGAEGRIGIQHRRLDLGGGRRRRRLRQVERTVAAAGESEKSESEDDGQPFSVNIQP